MTLTARLRTPVAPTLVAIAALAATLLPHDAHAVKWEKIADTGAATALVDRDSLKRQGNQVRAFIEWRWARPAVNDTDGREYVMERQLQLANCDNRAWAVAEGTRYADVAGVNPINSFKYDELSLPWSVAPSRTIRDAVVLHVCKIAPPEAKSR